VKQRLACVRRADQGKLGGAFGADDVRRAATSAVVPGPPELLGQLLDSPLDVALEMVRALVLRHDAEHLAKAV